MKTGAGEQEIWLELTDKGDQVLARRSASLGRTSLQGAGSGPPAHENAGGAVGQPNAAEALKSRPRSISASEGSGDRRSAAARGRAQGRSPMQSLADQLGTRSASACSIIRSADDSSSTRKRRDLAARRARGRRQSNRRLEGLSMSLDHCLPDLERKGEIDVGRSKEARELYAELAAITSDRTIPRRPPRWPRKRPSSASRRPPRTKSAT
jgi:hypothetical protein